MLLISLPLPFANQIPKAADNPTQSFIGAVAF
jgi:hypothetical protein